MRSLDLGTKEHVELLWILEGYTHLRCHRGCAFMYHEGAFQVYRGMISESTLTRVKDDLWELEGLFRLMPKERGCQTSRSLRSELTSRFSAYRYAFGYMRCAEPVSRTRVRIGYAGDDAQHTSMLAEEIERESHVPMLNAIQDLFNRSTGLASLLSRCRDAAQFQVNQPPRAGGRVPMYNRFASRLETARYG